MAEVVTLGIYGLVALVLGIPAALFAAARQKKTGHHDAPVVPAATMTRSDTIQAASVAAPEVSSRRKNAHQERVALGYAAPPPRVCGICHSPLSPYVLRTHDGQWRCPAHKVAA